MSKFLNMRTLRIICVLFFLINIIHAQHLDVEGDAKIAGKIDIDDGHASLILGTPAAPNSTGNRNVFL